MEITQYKEPNQPGIITGEPNDVYHATDALSNSSFKDFMESPRRYQARHITGEIQRQQKDCFDFGAMFHMAVLEPDLFTRSYTTYSPPEYKGTGAKQRREDYDAEWEAKYPEAKRMTFDQDVLLAHMTESIREVITFFPTDLHEVTFRAKTEFGLMQCRVDLLESNMVQPWDFKTCRNIAKVQQDFWKFGYDRQDAFYRYVMEAITGISVPPMKFLAVETSAPYETGVFQVTLEEAEMARHELFADLCRYAECKKRNNWPGMYGKDPIELPAPSYRRKHMEDTIAGSATGFQLLAEFENEDTNDSEQD